jgi:ABC-type Fe3+-hydroxamate transport system substrate-binding protein
MGQEVAVPDSPQRIISLVPSQTELLFELGLDEQIVGLTRFCIHPGNKTHAKERIGGTKDFDLEKIKALNPDLIIGNKEENYEEGITELKKLYPVWMSDITTLEDSYDMMSSIGDMTGRQTAAKNLVGEIKNGFSQIISLPDRQAGQQSTFTNNSCAYFIWRKPYMVAAKGTFIDQMLGILGVRNVFDDKDRYPEVTAADIAARKPDWIFLSSEPYSFTDKHKAEFRAICPNARILIVNGELFSWYGSRLKYTPEYFKQLRDSMAEVKLLL